MSSTRSLVKTSSTARGGKKGGERDGKMGDAIDLWLPLLVFWNLAVVSGREGQVD